MNLNQLEMKVEKFSQASGGPADASTPRKKYTESQLCQHQRIQNEVWRYEQHQRVGALT